MKKEVYINEYRDYRKGLREPGNRELYIDSVVKHYGSNFAEAFNTEVYDLIIRMDSFFENISSKDAAEILKRAETLAMPSISTTALLQKTFGSSVKYTFSDTDRKRRPVYRDESLRGLYGWKKKFKEME